MRTNIQEGQPGVSRLRYLQDDYRSVRAIHLDTANNATTLAVAKPAVTYITGGAKFPGDNNAAAATGPAASPTFETHDP